MFTLA